MHNSSKYSKIYYLSLQVVFFCFTVMATAQTSVAEAIPSCIPEISGLADNSYLPLEGEGQEIISLSVIGIGGSSGTFIGSGAKLITLSNAAYAQIDTRWAKSGAYEISYTIDKYAYPGCKLGEKSSKLAFFVDGDISENEVSVERSATFAPNKSFQLKPTPSIETYSKPEFRYSIDKDETSAANAQVSSSGFVKASGVGQITVVVTEINLLSASYPTRINIAVK